nr:MAG TPA: hypothetical protein [Caudoviricetes sp.]
MTRHTDKSLSDSFSIAWQVLKINTFQNFLKPRFSR